jgi:hypothetical protein
LSAAFDRILRATERLQHRPGGALPKNDDGNSRFFCHRRYSWVDARTAENPVAGKNQPGNFFLCSGWGSWKRHDIQAIIFSGEDRF